MELLRLDSTRERVLEAVREQDNLVGQFFRLLLREEADQRAQLIRARDDVTVQDDRQCR